MNINECDTSYSWQMHHNWFFIIFNFEKNPLADANVTGAMKKILYMVSTLGYISDKLFWNINDFFCHLS